MFVFEIQRKPQAANANRRVAPVQYDNYGNPIYNNNAEYVVADSFESACRWMDNHADRKDFIGLTQKFPVAVAPLQGVEVKA